MKDTAAWHVIEQLLKHVWGMDDMDDEDILSSCKMFSKAGGLWKKLMDGDQKHIGILEECIGNVLEARRLSRVASRIAGLRYR